VTTARAQAARDDRRGSASSQAIEGQSVRRFDKEQATYNRKRLEDLTLVSGPAP
jgi:hypothetical protein